MNFRTLVTPVFAAVAVGVTAFILLVIFAASEQDRLSIESERAVLRHELDSQAQTFQSFATDNAWWDTAVIKIILVEDMEWLESVLGTSARDIEFVDGSMALRGDHSVIFSSTTSNPGKLSIAPAKLLSAGLSHALKTLNIKEDASKHTVSGLLAVDGMLVAFGASLVHPNNVGSFELPLPDARPVVVFYGVLSDAEIAQIGADNLVRELQHFSEQPTTPGMLALKDADEHIVSWLGWVPKDPGTQMALDMVGPAFILLAFVVFAMVRFTKQATRLVAGLEQANKSKTSFLASMSHEVRTPLNSILGFTELISLELFGKVEGRKNKEYLGLIRNSGEHLLAIINDILDISKLEAGKYDVYAEKVDPASIVKNCLAMVETVALDRGVTLTNQCETVSLYSDERIMRQVLLNILSNAVKFTNRDGVVHVVGEGRPDHYVIEVTDTGIGMSAKDIEVAFETFGQVQNEYARSHSGTGLGLPLVNRFMTLLDGDIGISSKLGKGTTVTLIFPYRTQAKSL